MNPSPAHEQLLRRLRQQLHHHNGGASVVYLFSDYTLANQWLLAELDTHVLTPASATEAPAVLLQSILASGGQEPAGRPYWLALGNPTPEWDAYRDRVLARLNESRSVLVKNRAFIFLLLPAHFESRAAEVAPDLWSIRSASYVVAPWSGRDEPLKVPVQISPESEWIHGSVPPVAALLHWQAQWDAWNSDRSQQLSPHLAWLLVDELLEQQTLEQLGQARTVAMQALELCRQLRIEKGNTPENLRDLSISLNSVGDVENEAGRGEQALAAYRESLEIRRQLRQALGDSPQVLRDLSVSLNSIGNAESVMERGEQALVAYRESLEIFRQLRQLLGENSQVLCDLSMSLDNVGYAERVAGRGDQALAAYRESLEIFRQLRQFLGENPEVLRDLSISLNNVGDVESVAGRGEQALAAYRESLEIFRQLRQMLGDSPQVLDDLAFSLGRLATQPGLEMQARQNHFNEALSLREQLVAALPQNTWYRQRLDVLRGLEPSLPAPSTDAS